jgi:predicted DNA-binding ribbon-helix-helix protein
MEKKEPKFKQIKVETPVWKELKQLALDRNMTLQSEVTEILKAFLKGVKESKKDKAK